MARPRRRGGSGGDLPAVPGRGSRRGEPLARRDGQVDGVVVRRERADPSVVVRMAAGSAHTLGLRADGTVVSAGNNASHQCDVGSWSGIQERLH